MNQSDVVEAWTAENARRWDELCSRSPDDLTNDEIAEGLALAERAYALLIAGKEVQGVAVIEVMDADDQ